MKLSTIFFLRIIALWFLLLVVISCQPHQPEYPVPPELIGIWRLDYSLKFHTNGQTERQESTGKTVVFGADKTFSAFYDIGSALYQGNFRVLGPNHVEVTILRNPVNKPFEPYTQEFRVTRTELVLITYGDAQASTLTKTEEVYHRQ